MRLKAMVLGHDTYNLKKGGVGHTLTVLDQDTDHRLKDTFDYNVSQLDMDRHGDPTQLVNKVVEIGVTECAPGFGKRLVLRGSIISGTK